VLSVGGTSLTASRATGTSASAPLWAGIIALADQYAGRHLGFVDPAIYRIALSARYRQAFHDVTSGDSTASFPPVTIAGYRAAPGWDPVTGWGSPDANVLVPLLARYGDYTSGSSRPARYAPEMTLCAEGEARGKAEDILVVFEQRGIDVDKRSRELIGSCADLGTLNDWFRRAFKVDTASDLFEE
jgi:hypothetical protein